MAGEARPLIKVIVGHPLMERQVPRIAAASPFARVEFRLVASRAAADDLVDPDAEAIFGSFAPRDRSRTPRLRWQQLVSAGVDHLLADPPWHSGLIVTNAAGVYALPMAQYVIAQVLRVSELMEVRRDLQLARRWPDPSEEEGLTGRLLRKQTLLIIGYGGVGREVARLARAFGMRILAVKSRATNLPDNSYRVPGTGDPDGTIPDMIASLDELDALIPEADFVALTLPLTDRSRGLLDARRLRLMRPDAWLINVGRGPLADEAALADALRERRIGGAALDVFGTEPLPPDSPFWTLPNTIVSPHLSGADSAAPDTLAELFIENLRLYASGEPLLNVIDPVRQY